MDAAQARELGVPEAGDEPEYFLLGAPGEPGLETHEVEVVPGEIVLAELDHRVGIAPRAGVVQAHGFHGAVPQRLAAPVGHDFDGEAGFE